jgi:ArsR family transcriptional regulator
MSAPAASTDVDPVVRLFRALGDPARLRIVALLSHGELCVCHLEQALGLSQPAVSRHLAVLRAAGVVTVRRDGSWAHYSLQPQASAAAEQQLACIVGSFSEKKALARETAKLRKGSGPGFCR